jgi:type I restriction enzyme S subunit
MNQIEKLIATLCPNGVEHIKLGNLESDGVIKLGRGEVISKTDLANHEGDFPVYSSSASELGIFGYYGKYMFDDVRITWSIDGGGKFFFRHSHKYSVTNVCGWLKVLKEEALNPKYLYYVLISVWATRTYNYTVKAHPSVIKEDYFIPLPPIEIQNEIVKILDTFSELEAELEAELDARFIQRHYVVQSFQNGKLPGLKSAAQIPLEELVHFENGKPHEPFVDPDGDCELITARFISTNGAHARRINSIDIRTLAQVNDITIVLSDLPNGKALAKCFFVKKANSLAVNQRIAILRSRDVTVADPEYLYHFVNRNSQILKYDDGSTQTHLKKANVLDTIVFLPDIETQRKIAKDLSMFEHFLVATSESLPAEIAARRQQYEYYRDKLLTFKELESA